ncbi:MAG: hypothetical protein ACO25B_00005, partial [Chitinophagaceae bacterium]
MRATIFTRIRKFILPGVLFFAFSFTQNLVAGQATVMTDKADYYPGDTVVITGSGWWPGETVQLDIEHSTVSHGFTTLFATADANGNIFNNQFIIQPEHLGELFYLYAFGLSSGYFAETIFTDATAVTPASGGTNIPADKAANASSPAYTTLGDITVSEGRSSASNRGDFSAPGGTLILTAPAGWKFNPGIGSVTYTASNDITAATITVTAYTITVNLTIPTVLNNDQFKITGIQVQADNGSVLPSSGNILRVSGNAGTAVLAGVVVDVTNFGSLSQKHGALHNFRVESSAGGNIPDQTVATAFNIKLTARDQFNNTVISFSGGTNKATISSNATLTSGSGLTSAFSSGVLSSHSVIIDPAFTGATITATKDAVSGTSNSFNVTGASGGLTVTAATCAQGGTFSITYTPETGPEVTLTGQTTPRTFTARKNTAYSITSIQSPVNGNNYTGAATVSGTTPNENNFSTEVVLSYSDNTAPVVNAPNGSSTVSCAANATETFIVPTAT